MIVDDPTLLTLKRRRLSINEDPMEPSSSSSQVWLPFPSLLLLPYSLSSFAFSSPSVSNLARSVTESVRVLELSSLGFCLEFGSFDLIDFVKKQAKIAGTVEKYGREIRVFETSSISQRPSQASSVARKLKRSL